MTLTSKDLTSEEVTSWFLYGTKDVPTYYGDRIRDSSAPGATLTFDAVEFLASGPGRYLIQLFSDLPIVREFFARALSNPTRHETVSLDMLAGEIGDKLNGSGNWPSTVLSIVNFKIDASNPDYADRTYVWGSISAILRTATFVFDGDKSTIKNINFRPANTDFDFHSTEFVTNTGGALKLIPEIDPYQLGDGGGTRKVDLVFDSASKDATGAVLSNYSLARFASEVDVNHNRLYNGSVSTANSAVNQVIDRLNTNGIIDYRRKNEGYTVYGTNEGSDELAVHRFDQLGVVVGGKGDDVILGGHKSDTLIGGEGTDAVRYDLEYEFYGYTLIAGRAARVARNKNADCRASIDRLCTPVVLRRPLSRFVITSGALSHKGTSKWRNTL